MIPATALTATTFSARALFIGERIDTRSLAPVERLAIAPLTVPLNDGIVVVFRYGAVVFFNVSGADAQGFLDRLRPMVSAPYDSPESEDVTIQIDAEMREGYDAGRVYLREPGLERLQVVAIVLGKSAVLSQYEGTTDETLDRIEPFAVQLQQRSRGGRNAKELLRHIGASLMSELKMVGRVEVHDKPELVWERPELEHLYLRLEEEYELRDRHAALDRKFELISRTVRTVFELLQNDRILRVEWYIVLLIIVEIMLTLYEQFFHS